MTQVECDSRPQQRGGPFDFRDEELLAAGNSRVVRDVLLLLRLKSKAVYRHMVDQLILESNIGPVPLSEELAVAPMSDPVGPSDSVSLFRHERDVYAGTGLAKRITEPAVLART